MTNQKKVLIISPHPDDGILGCGATIAKLLEEGAEVKYVILSWAGQGFTNEEIKNALKTLGIKESQQLLLNYEVRNFPYCSSAIREELRGIRESFKPNLILCHNSHDIHQDHQIASQEAFRVFREESLWGYVLPWNLREFKFDMFYIIEKKHLDIKLVSLKKLISQQERFYYNPQKIEAEAITFGMFRRKEYAEAFEILSQIIK